MKFGVGAALVGALMLGGCQTAAGPNGGVASMTAQISEASLSGGPAGTKVGLKNPDPTKWDARRVQSATVWICRPLACADSSTGVIVQFSRAPTRNPDPEALRKLAKILPAQTNAQNAVLEIASDGQEKVEALSSRVTKLRDFPAIVTETKRSGRGKATYTAMAHVFIGMAQAKITSLSLDRAVAKRHLDDFVSALEIEDRPPAAAPVASSGASETPTAAAPAS